MSLEAESLSPHMTVLSLLNGMIGGFILILPVFALQAGYISTMLVIIITGVFSYYSCHLSINHMGNQKDLDAVIFKHFNKSTKMKTLYDLCIWSSLLLIDFLYFELIVIQWIGLAPPHSFTVLNAILNAFLLFGITMAMKYLDFGANLMAYGIVSILSYLIFLTWVVGNEQKRQNYTQYKAFGSGAAELAAGMGQAFAIQSFFIPILKKARNIKSHKKYVLIAYVMGGIGYTFIAFMGSYGILYRDYLGYSDGQRTIEGYFGIGTWQVNVIEIIYLIHLYSVFPQFLLISKVRLFGVLKYQNTSKGKFNAQEIIYFTVAVTICLAITLLNISIRDIIDLNGALIGCVLFYFIPAALHVKCLYFSPNKIAVRGRAETKPMEKQKYVEMIEEVNVDLEGQQKDRNNLEAIMHKENGQVKQSPRFDAGQLEPKDRFQCDCSKSNYTKRERVFIMVMIAAMVGFGIFIMTNGIITLST